MLLVLLPYTKEVRKLIYLLNNAKTWTFRSLSISSNKTYMLLVLAYAINDYRTPFTEIIIQPLPSHRAANIPNPSSIKIPSNHTARPGIPDALAPPVKNTVPFPFPGPNPNPAVINGPKPSVLVPTTATVSPGANETFVPKTVIASPGVSV